MVFWKVMEKEVVVRFREMWYDKLEFEIYMAKS
mgnify:CR=1 FL=1